MAELIPGASRLLKAASQLDSALRYAEGAVNVDVPFLLGRGAATELLQSHLGNSVEWAQSASVELASAPAGIEHVRSAVDELARAAAAIRDDHPVRGRGSSAFTDAIAGARQARADMYQHLDGLNAAANDDAAAWLDGSLAPGGDPSRIRATRDLVGMGAFGDLGDVGSFVERMAPDSPRSVELAALARASGAEAAGRALFEDAHAIAAAGAPVDAADFDLAFRAMGRPLPPAFVGRSDTARLDAFELAALRRAADTTDASALAARLAEQLDGPLRSPTPALLADLGALAELPSSLIDGLDPGVIAQSRSLAERLRAGTNRATQLPTGLTPSTQLLGMWKASAMSRGGGTTPVIQALLDQSDGGVEAAQRLATFVADDISGGPVAWREEILRKLNMADQDPAAGALIDALRIAGDGTSVAPALHQRALELARSGDTGPGTRRELATLAALPDELRPSFLDGERDRMLHEIAHDRTDVMGDVRWKADRTLIDADPEWGRSFAEEETRRLVALRTDASSADLLRLARLAQLPDELRPPLSRAITTAFTERTGAGHGIGDPEVARFLRAMRGELLSVDIERGNADVDTVRTQIRTLLAKPDAEITAADLDELAMLRAIPGPASPGMPAPVEYRLDQLVEYGYTGSAEAARRELDHLRTWLQRLDITSDSAVTRDTLRQDVRAIVAKPNAEVTPEHIRQLSVLGGVTGEKSLGIPRLRGNSLQDLASWRYGGTNAHAELDHLREWIQHLDIDADPSITRDTLREEVRAIVGKADGDVTADDVKRLAMLNDITGPKALEMPTVRSYSLRDAAGYGYAGSNLANQLDDLRAWVQRLDIDADPAITRDTLRTEVRTIVGKADVDVTHDDIKRLSLLNDITGAKSLEMPTTRDYSLRDLVSYNYGGSNATRQLDDLRAWIQRLDIDADPAITRDTLREEVRAIVGKADGDVSTADIKRLAMFNDITGAKALEMPKLRDTSLRDLVSYGYGG
ncbi:MAG: hypothetical protein JWL76_2154, partial [Thermoleophilia bacterium]|nr:hypothetical protein [Thermoleophilia bacterium]